MRISCTRRLHFSAGHRVMGHEGHCANLHGHNYVVYLDAVPWPALTPLDGIGRVVDFAVLKARIGAWIDEQWDHAFIVNEADEEVLELLFMADDAFEHGQKFFRFPGNPTAEELARYLLTVVCPEVLVDTGARVVRVEVEETENCSATAELIPND